jgi:hypothetical protein
MQSRGRRNADTQSAIDVRSKGAKKIATLVSDTQANLSFCGCICDSQTTGQSSSPCQTRDNSQISSAFGKEKIQRPIHEQNEKKW